MPDREQQKNSCPSQTTYNAADVNVDADRMQMWMGCGCGCGWDADAVNVDE